MHTPQVKHGPTELLSFGIGHNLVVYGIVIAVRLNVEVAEEATVPCLRVTKPQVVLDG